MQQFLMPLNHHTLVVVQRAVIVALTQRVVVLPVLPVHTLVAVVALH
jgi:hypothetical protein